MLEEKSSIHIAKPACRCGHDINHPLISVKTRYSTLGYFWLSLAFSAMPIEVIFQCQQCNEVIARSDDPEFLEKYRYSSDIMR